MSIEAKRNAMDTLSQAGMKNPSRIVSLIKRAISSFQLDLSGLIVLTEAASGFYVVTPVIAALAGAKKVFALTRESGYATIDVVKVQTRALETLCGIENRAEIFTQRLPELFSQADIITNLGFVRPIDSTVVKTMKSTAVIPLMCEVWEFRSGDVDLDACRIKGVQFMGTNEDYPGLEIFDYCGELCLKMLFKAQVEVSKSNILLIGDDKISRAINKKLKQIGSVVYRMSRANEIPEEILTHTDAMIIADYTRENMIIGPGGDITAEQLSRIAPTITLIQFAGLVDRSSLSQCGIAVFPNQEIGSHRMARTLAYLGPRPVIELHTAGLKVGQLLIENTTLHRSIETSQYKSLCMPMDIK